MAQALVSLRQRRTALFVAGWCLLAGAGAIRLDRLGVGTIFYYDEWSFVLDRWRPSFRSIFAPHNGHLTALPATVYTALFHSVGLDHYRAYRWAAIAVHLMAVGSTALYVRRRQGEVAALAAGAALLLLAAGQDNLLYPFQMTFTGSVAGFAIALLLLDRRTAAGDAGAALALAAAAACSGVGVAAIPAVTAELGLRKATWRRLWSPLSAGAVYLVWFVTLGESQADRRNLGLAPRYVLESMVSAVGGLFNLEGWPAGLLTLAVLGAFLRSVAAHRRISPRQAGLIVFALMFWALAALSRGSIVPAGANRYVYVGAAVVLLLAAETARFRSGAAIAVASAVLAAGSVWSGWARLDLAAQHLRLATERTAAELAALELARGVAPPSYVPDLEFMPPVVAGPYFAAVDGIGSSPAYPLEALAELPDAVRASVDRVLREAAPPLVATSEADPAACTTPIVGEREVEAASGQLRLVVIGGAVEVRTRRFADRYADAADLIAPASTATLLRFAPDASSIPWRVQLSSVEGAAWCVETA